jgi:O-antigen ligase
MVAGSYASYLSGTRGGWIALPVLLWATVAGRGWYARKRTRVALILAVVVCFGALAGTELVRERFDAIGSDVRLAGEGNMDTSLGERLDLWRAATRLYVHHPVLGVGRGSLEPALRSLAQKGEVPSRVVNGRAHSDIFAALAETGTIGLAMLLLLYLGTFHAFWRYRHSADPDIASASYLGIALVGSTIVFGMTIDVFTLVMNVAFFALTAVTLLAWIEARRRELRQSSAQEARATGRTS